MICEPQVHVTWWDNFSKVHAFQKADMSRTNFTLCLWTVCGVQRQSLPSQQHVIEGGHSNRLMSFEEFKVSRNNADALPADILSVALVNKVKNQWFARVGATRSFWEGNLRARKVNRVPLKLPRGESGNDAKACGQCNDARQRCGCSLEQLNGDAKVNDSNDILNLSTSAAIDDHISGSPDGLLNFFPFQLRRFNIGSKVGLARLLAEFNICHGDKDVVKILNTDVQIFERIIKVITTSRIHSCHVHLEHIILFFPFISSSLDGVQ